MWWCAGTMTAAPRCTSRLPRVTPTACSSWWRGAGSAPCPGTGGASHPWWRPPGSTTPPWWSCCWSTSGRRWARSPAGIRWSSGVMLLCAGRVRAEPRGGGQAPGEGENQAAGHSCSVAGHSCSVAGHSCLVAGHSWSVAGYS